ARNRLTSLTASSGPHSNLLMVSPSPEKLGGTPPCSLLPGLGTRERGGSALRIGLVAPPSNAWIGALQQASTV
ncbi:MAG: hypothetical protein ACPIOQ_13945, partial [Promethearchaeia archaeon]